MKRLKTKFKKITEGSLVSISLTVGVATGTGVGALWVGNVNAELSRTARRHEHAKAERLELLDRFSALNDFVNTSISITRSDMVRLETKIDLLIEMEKKHGN